MFAYPQTRLHNTGICREKFIDRFLKAQEHSEKNRSAAAHSPLLWMQG